MKVLLDVTGLISHWSSSLIVFIHRHRDWFKKKKSWNDKRKSGHFFFLIPFNASLNSISVRKICLAANFSLVTAVILSYFIGFPILLLHRINSLSTFCTTNYLGASWLRQMKHLRESHAEEDDGVLLCEKKNE